MSKISELSDGGVVQGGDTLIAVRSGGNVKVTYGGSTTANIDGGTIDDTVIGGTTPAAGTFTTGQFDTSVNVDGTVTADGLTVDGNANFDSGTLFVNASANRVGINTSSPLALLSLSGSSAYTVGSSGRAVQGLDINAPADGSGLFGGAISLGVGGAGRASISAVQGTADNDTVGLAFSTHPSGTGGADAVQFMQIDPNGDISFYEDTGTTAKFFWDASAESLGIGTSSPDSFSSLAKNLVVDAATNAGITISDNTGSGTCNLVFAASSSFPNKGNITYDMPATAMTFGINAAEAMRIDSSRNLLVGTTTAVIANSAVNVGTAIGSGLIESARAGVVAQLNRHSTDGSILDFQKDGNTVGSIGTDGNHTYFVGNDAASGNGCGLLFGINTATPVNRTGGPYDGFLKLGSSSNRFKDLYLSGGVYLGGTAAANKLDDYEEGTFIPEFADDESGGNTASVSTARGRYVKVGKLVSVQIQLDAITTTGLTSGNAAYIRNLPFTTATPIIFSFGVQVDRVTFTGYVSGFINATTGVRSAFRCFDSSSGNAHAPISVSDFTSGSSSLFTSFTYETV